jgi:hypothetical protein
VQIIADECKQDFRDRATKYLEHIYAKQGTLNPDALKGISNIDRTIIQNIIRGLELYKVPISTFTLGRFKEAMQSLNDIEMQVISYNYLFPGKHIGGLLKISEKVTNGLLDAALQIECQKLYLAKAPDLITKIILDTKTELFA